MQEATEEGRMAMHFMMRMPRQSTGLPHDRRTTAVTVAAVLAVAALIAFLLITLTHAGRAY
jgi:hypothetical protein